MFEWFNAHKTKIAGFITAGLAALELSPVKDMIPTNVFVVVVFILGLVVMGIGIFNTQANTEAAVRLIANNTRNAR